MADSDFEDNDYYEDGDNFYWVEDTYTMAVGESHRARASANVAGRPRRARHSRRAGLRRRVGRSDPLRVLERHRVRLGRFLRRRGDHVEATDADNGRAGGEEAQGVASAPEPEKAQGARRIGWPASDTSPLQGSIDEEERQAVFPQRESRQHAGDLSATGLEDAVRERQADWRAG